MLKVIPRDISWKTRKFYLPFHPSYILESNCPKCGEKAIGDSEVYNPTFHFGNPDKLYPSVVNFTCYGRGPTPDTDCDTEWEEKVIFRLSIEASS